MSDPTPKVSPHRSSSSDLPRAIMHLDGDSFFVSCEVARRPDLRGKPVVTGLEKGIASAMSIEAKKRGIYRGMRIREMRRVCPEVVILPSDYRMYGQYAQRMYRIVRRYTDLVEEYSIDECFADLTNSPLARTHTYAEIAQLIQNDLHQSLGITFSVGLSVNKVMAKIASKWNKPAGMTVIGRELIAERISEIPINNIWGIGASTQLYLKHLGVATAGDLATKDRSWVAEYCDRPLARIYEELRGNSVMELELGGGNLRFSGGSSGGTYEGSQHKSVQCTRTFRPSSTERDFIWSQLSYHVEEACARLRRQGMTASRVSFFAKTTDFEYIGDEIALIQSCNEAQGILSVIEPRFNALLVSGLSYRATGVSLFGLRPVELATASLFDESMGLAKQVPEVVTRAMDSITHRFGDEIIMLGSSLRALRHERQESRRLHAGILATDPQGVRRKHFDLIFLGTVR